MHSKTIVYVFIILNVCTSRCANNALVLFML